MASVRKFDRVMVAIGHFGLDLVELADPPVGGSSPDPAVVVSDVLGERQFGAGKHADRHGRLAFGRKATGRCPAEGRGDQRLADLGWPRRHSMEAIVTHRMAPSFEIAARVWKEAQASIRADLAQSLFLLLGNSATGTLRLNHK